MLSKRPLLKKRWYDEPSEYLDYDRRLIRDYKKEGPQKAWQAKYPNFKEKVNSSQRLLDAKLWVDRWRRDHSMIIAGDRIAFQKSMPTYRSLLRWLLPRLARPATIIDYGCGTSVFCRLFSEHMPEAEYVLVDVGSPALGYAHERCRLYASRVRTIEVNEDNLCPQLPAADLIFCRNVLEHVWHPDVVLRNFYKSLKNDGLVILNFPGVTGETARKSDTQRAYDLRDQNIMFMYSHFQLLKGRHYRFAKGHFLEDGFLKIWRKKSDFPDYFLADETQGLRAYAP